MTGTISRKIVQRFMTPEEFALFEEKYSNAKQKLTYAGRQVNDKDLEIYKKYVAGSRIPALSKEYGLSVSKIQGSILLACKQ